MTHSVPLHQFGQRPDSQRGQECHARANSVNCVTNHHRTNSSCAALNSVPGRRCERGAAQDGAQSRRGIVVAESAFLQMSVEMLQAHQEPLEFPCPLPGRKLCAQIGAQVTAPGRGKRAAMALAHPVVQRLKLPAVAVPYRTRQLVLDFHYVDEPCDHVGRKADPGIAPRYPYSFGHFAHPNPWVNPVYADWSGMKGPKKRIWCSLPVIARVGASDVQRRQIDVCLSKVV